MICGYLIHDTWGSEDNFQEAVLYFHPVRVGPLVTAAAVCSRLCGLRTFG